MHGATIKPCKLLNNRGVIPHLMFLRVIFNSSLSIKVQTVVSELYVTYPSVLFTQF